MLNNSNRNRKGQTFLGYAFSILGIATLVTVAIAGLNNTFNPNQLQNSSIALASNGITKNAVNPADGSNITQINPGSDVRWVINYNNDSGAVKDSYTINDSIPTGTNYKLNTLKAPGAFGTKSFSTDGVNYNTTEPSTQVLANAVTKLRATGSNIPSPATGLVQTLQQPVLQAVGTTSVTGGDGWAPIFYHKNNPDGSVTTKIFTIFHHIGGNDSTTLQPKFQINCVALATGGLCPGYPKYFSSTAGTSNTGTNDIITSWIESYGYLQDGKIYYGAQRQNDNGVGCFDADLDVNCGFTKLGDLGNLDTQQIAGNSIASPNPGFVSGSTSTDGVRKVGNKIYLFGSDTKVYCFDLSTATSCVGQPYSPLVPSDGIVNLYALNTRTNIPTVVVGNKIFSAHHNNNQPTSGGGSRITCFDTITNAKCTGWTSISTTANESIAAGLGGQSFYSLIPTYNQNLEPVGICAVGSVQFGVDCFNVNNMAPIAVPANLLTGTPDPAYDRPHQADLVGSKSYITVWSGVNNPDQNLATANDGLVVCYDWVTQSKCAGFGTNGIASYPNINAGKLKIYTTTYDRGCMYGLGDAGYLWSFDPQTGISPCQVTSSSSTVEPLSNFYCDGKTHTITWDKIKVLDAGYNVSGLSTITAQVYDKNGRFIKSGELLTSGEISIADVSYGTNQTFGNITNLDTTVLQVSAFGYGNQAAVNQLAGKRIGAFFTGDAPQVCFDTKISEVAPSGNLTNTASETAFNTSGSSTIIVTTTDTDGDGIPNDLEGSGDTDGDTIPDYLDTDSDNDGIPDSVEKGSTCATITNCTPVDTDGDGTPNFKDTDSDNDGIPDSVEARSNNGTPVNGPITNPVDTDGDTIPDYIDTDSDNDTLLDSAEKGLTCANLTACVPVDTDTNTVPDYRQTAIVTLDQTTLANVVENSADCLSSKQVNIGNVYSCSFKLKGSVTNTYTFDETCGSNCAKLYAYTATGNNLLVLNNDGSRISDMCVIKENITPNARLECTKIITGSLTDGLKNVLLSFRIPATNSTFTNSPYLDKGDVTLVNPGTTPINLKPPFTIDDVAGLTVNCTEAKANSSTSCTFTLPENKTLPSDFKLSIGNGNPGGTCSTETVTNINKVTCTDIPTGSEAGLKDIYGNIGNAKKETGEKVNILPEEKPLTQEDMANLASLTNLTCTPDPVNIDSTVTCKGTLPSGRSTPNEPLKLNVEGKDSVFCVFAGKEFTCSNMPVGTITGTRNIQAAIGFKTPVNTGKTIKINEVQITNITSLVRTGGTALVGFGGIILLSLGLFLLFTSKKNMKEDLK